MKIVTLSDLHMRWHEVDVPDGDVLVVAGDMTGTGSAHAVSMFGDWLATLPHKHKLVVPGNHDWLFQTRPEFADSLIFDGDVLIDEAIVIDGVKFYGSPWQPEFCNWAFNLPRGKELADKWALIPDDTDVLITHGPPRSILDTNHASDDPRKGFGCDDLYARVMKVKPKYHIFGHIHGGYGKTTVGETTFVNTAICTEEYEPLNKPWVLEIDECLISEERLSRKKVKTREVNEQLLIELATSKERKIVLQN